MSDVSVDAAHGADTQEEFTLRWDVGMGMYRVSVPGLCGPIRVVPKSVLEAERELKEVHERHARDYKRWLEERETELQTERQQHEQEHQIAGERFLAERQAREDAEKRLAELEMDFSTSHADSFKEGRAAGRAEIHSGLDVANEEIERLCAREAAIEVERDRFKASLEQLEGVVMAPETTGAQWEDWVKQIARAALYPDQEGDGDG